MNTASLELCKELYELSGWNDTYFSHETFLDDSDEPSGRLQSIPAYDLGYLLRNLPLGAKTFRDSMVWHVWLEAADNQTGKQITAMAGNPEDAAAKLAIELFKRGILSKTTA